MALKRFTDNAQTPEKKRVAIPLTSSADNTDYYATGADMAEIVLNNTARLWDLKATVLPTCRSFRDREYLKAGSWFFEDISNTEDKPDKLKEKNVQFARLLCEEGQSAQEGLKFVKQYLFYVNMTDNELELSMRGLLLNGNGGIQGATPWKTGVDEADVAKEAINAKSADIATQVIDDVKNKSGNMLITEQKGETPLVSTNEWVRIAELYAGLGVSNNFILFLNKIYNNSQNASATFLIQDAYEGMNVNQLGNCNTETSYINGIRITKDKKNDYKSYLEISKYGYSTDAVRYNIIGENVNVYKKGIKVTSENDKPIKFTYKVVDGIAINGVNVITANTQYFSLKKQGWYKVGFGTELVSGILKIQGGRINSIGGSTIIAISSYLVNPAELNIKIMQMAVAHNITKYIDKIAIGKRCIYIHYITDIENTIQLDFTGNTKIHQPIEITELPPSDYTTVFNLINHPSINGSKIAIEQAKTLQAYNQGITKEI